MEKKTFLFFSIVLVISFFLFQCSDNITNPVIRELTPLEKQVVSSSGNFGFNLFKEVNKTSKNNVFISPFSVSMALGMALNGAAGSTYEAMQSTLQFSSLTKEQINDSYKSLIDLLTQIDPKVRFDVANSVWHKYDLNLEKKFIDVNKKYFNAEVKGVDFNNKETVDIINDWVNKNTNGKIKKIFDSKNNIQDMIICLINAIYFKGTWKYEFKKENTADDVFYGVNGEELNCKMMNQKNKFKYYENTDVQIVDLPYGNGNFSMTVVLPNENINVDQIVENMNSTVWNNWLDSLKEEEGMLQLPKFKIELEYNLNKILINLGMEIAFSGSADFSNMFKPGQLPISEVKHKTFVKVDEEGTEAAAVTSVSYSRTVSVHGFSMKVDRPFIFAIRENNTGAILFIGKIINPKN